MKEGGGDAAHCYKIPLVANASRWRAWFKHGGVPSEDDYLEAPDQAIGGNSVAALHDGREAFPAMLAAIEGAKSTVHLETYLLQSDRIGWVFAKALAKKARSAVQVRVIFDSLGSLDIAPQYIQFLRNNGISMLEYHPVAPWRRRWAWGRRDHRKILVVDSRIGFTGSINIADQYADPADGGGGWRDTQVRVEGPAAYELDRLFRATWYRETGRWFTLEGLPDQTAGRTLVMVAANQEFLHRHRIRKAYLHALRRAKKSISIVNAYFIPDRGIRRALYRAGRRGVCVRALLPGKSDVPAADYAGHFRFGDHLRNGVRLFEWPGSVLHAKSVVVDGVWSAVGSYNMDHRSLMHNLEVNLHIQDKKFGAQMEKAFEKDISLSREIQLADWLKRPSQERLLEGMCYLLRYWL